MSSETTPPQPHASMRDGGAREASPHREALIAQAAYLRAANRGFQGGDPVADWLEAEAEIDAWMASGKQRGAEEPRSSDGNPSAERAQPADADRHALASQLDAASQRLEKLRPKLDELKRGARGEMDRELHRLDALRDDLAHKAGDMRRRSEKKRGDWKQQAEKLLRDLKAGLERLGSRFDR